jgi:hypothetical protein
MVRRGLLSTQRRICQTTYRFLLSGSVLGGLRWLREKEALDLLKVIERARESFEADIYLPRGKLIEQILEKPYTNVENMKNHPLTLTPIVPKENPDPISWVWMGQEYPYPLGIEEIFTAEEKQQLNRMEYDRVSPFSAWSLTDMYRENGRKNDYTDRLRRSRK